MNIVSLITCLFHERTLLNQKTLESYHVLSRRYDNSFGRASRKRDE